MAQGGHLSSVDIFTQRHKKERVKSRRSSDREDFEGLVNKSIPQWNAFWTMLLQASKEKRKWKPTAKTTRVINSADLQKKIRKKVTELLDEEEILVNLYEKAAEVARTREIELKDKTAHLLEQIKKDRNFLKNLKEHNI